MSSANDPYGFDDEPVEQPPGNPQHQWAQQPQWGQQPYRPPTQPQGGCGRAVAIFAALLNIVVLLILLGTEMIHRYLYRTLGEEGPGRALLVYELTAFLTLILGLVSIGVTRGLPRLGATVSVLALIGAGATIAVAQMEAPKLAGLGLVQVAPILAVLHGLAAALLFIPSARPR